MNDLDKSYTDLRLASVYDSLNPWAADSDFYYALAGSEPKRILDVGCGTGMLAVALAERGHRVTGADPSDGMLQIARNRPGGDTVNWVQSRAEELDLDDRFDLIVMNGHAFQVFLDDTAIQAALAAFHRHLVPGGMAAFETRNPARESWRHWIPKESEETVEVPGIGPVRVFNSLVDGSRNKVTYRTHFQFPDGTDHIGEGTLRLLEVDELKAHVSKAGFSVAALYGDWDKRPVGTDEKEIIALVVRD